VPVLSASAFVNPYSRRNSNRRLIMPAAGKIYDDHGTPPKTQPDESHSGSVRQNQNRSSERTRSSAPTTTAPRREVHLTPGR
jgi:hypothetical protein